jgi:hypothetical protein
MRVMACLVNVMAWLSVGLGQDGVDTQNLLSQAKKEDMLISAGLVALLVLGTLGHADRAGAGEAFGAPGMAEPISEAGTKYEELAALAKVAAGDAPKEPRGTDVQSVIVAAAHQHGLPIGFFRKLIWQESRFRTTAVSPVGALGIAQFMPGTAFDRGLSDPFDPVEALYESARLLRDLWGDFGNLGLAAAAYNAGPRRVTRWLAGEVSLPLETREYVQSITGESAEFWSRCRTDQAKQTKCTDPSWVDLATPSPRSGAQTTGGAYAKALQNTAAPSAQAPWGLQLAGGWSLSRTLADFNTLQARFPTVLGERKPVVLSGRIAGRGSAIWYRVRVAETTRERATELCKRLEKAGGSCLVLRNL